MKYKLNAISLPNGITITLKNKKTNYNKTFTVSKSHINFTLVQQLLTEIQNTSLFLEKNKVEQNVHDKLLELSDAKKVLAAWSNGLLKIQGDTVTYSDQEISIPGIAEFLLQQFLKNPNETNGLNAWTNFIKAALLAGSYKVANRLFLFLQHNDLSIDSDGNVLCWKVVNSNYKDKYSNTFDNSPGQVVEIDRKLVDDNDSNYCSYGLHVCAWGYLKSFSGYGDPVMKVKINVADIIAIPLDYDGEKIRVSKYEVIEEVGKWNIDVDADRLPTNIGFSAKA